MIKEGSSFRDPDSSLSFDSSITDTLVLIMRNITFILLSQD
jgi:hypothetical protein